MIRLLIAFCCMFVAGPVLAQAPSNSSDEKAVRDVVQRYVDARERRDPAALTALFTADADQYTTAGEWRRGRDAVVKGGLASSQQNPGRRTIKVETVRFVAPGVAIADGPYTIVGGTSAETRPMWTTVVLTRSADGWRIAAVRNARPTAP